MTTDELREKYLQFFESKGCRRRPSDVLVPRADKTVLFTPAGMNQFKEQFLGQNLTLGGQPFTRAATCQKCLRTGDIGNVGVTAYHHTFFEMLGNFSFGDYFKHEAITWAWEFLTGEEWLKLDPETLSVTVYLDDDEAYAIWRDVIGLPPERIAREQEDENFWPASAPSEGPDGVCGPCSEIYYHAGGIAPGTTPNNDDGVEIWNLVFTQFERKGDPPNNLHPLPAQNIDTGMGLERTAAVLQGVASNYEIDSLRPLCEAAAAAVGKTYAFDAPHGRACRRIADHARAVALCVHEGVSPGREKEEYIVRLLLRRAALEGYLLGQDQPFLHTLVGPVVTSLHAAYPDLEETAESVAATIQEEEAGFLDTIDRGMAKYKKAAELGTIGGEDAFRLHTQDGFIIELIEELASRDGIAVDRAGFDAKLEDHRKLSGAGAFADSVMASGPLDAIRGEHGETTFLGYDETAVRGRVLGLIVDGEAAESVRGDAEFGLVLDRTPFYAEAGGQVGDTGHIESSSAAVTVLDTQKENGLYVHLARLDRGSLSIGDEVTATVDDARRGAIQRAHSATHVLHHALRQELGKNATQKGSKVQEDELRFDFAHGSSLSREQLQSIESEINDRVASGAVVTIENMPQQDARDAGAMMLFGEKYPDVVRVVSIGDFSKELCGGTHLSNSGQIGPVRLVGEDAVAKGVRRITAVTGPKALAKMRETEAVLREVAAAVKANEPHDIVRRVEAMQAEIRDLRAKLAAQTKDQLATLAPSLLASAESVGDAKIVTHLLEEGDRDQLRELADELRKLAQSVCVLLGADLDGKASLLAAVSKPLTKQGVKAGDCVKAAAKLVQGGGGGRPDLAEAGGKDPSKLADALEAGAAYYRAALAS